MRIYTIESALLAQPIRNLSEGCRYPPGARVIYGLQLLFLLSQLEIPLRQALFERSYSQCLLLLEYVIFRKLQFQSCNFARFRHLKSYE